MINRRTSLQATLGTLGLGVAAATLPGCGFKLRRAPEFAFDTIFLAYPLNSGLGNELRRNVAANPKVKVMAPADWKDADVVFLLTQEIREKVVVGLNASGQVREFQLRLRIRFTFGTPERKVLIPDTEIAQQRDISFNESAVLSKEAEETLLYRDMQTDIVQQLLRRLAAVKEI
jgi:LPS-assembly lipoprotein